MTSFHRWTMCAAVASLASSIAAAQPASRVAGSTAGCDRLRNLQLPDVRFHEVVSVADSADHKDNVRAPHCRVSGVIGRSTEFLIMLPYAWNQRLLMGGNGGYAGTINRGVMGNATSGYAVVSTNTGHEESPGGGARWALNNPEAQKDYGYLAVHRTAQLAKAITSAFYGTAPLYSYFVGCSNGGRQGLMEAERYPEDFNGIMSGAPAAHMSRTGASFLKNVQAVFPDSSYFEHPLITQANLDLLSAKVLEACDANDGVRDSIINDPRDCHFKLATVKACVGDRPADDCLTNAQRAAIARIYAPTTDRRGRVVYPGQTFGGENLNDGWASWISGRDSALMHDLHVPSAQAMFVTEGARYMLFNDSSWDYSRYQGSLADDAKAWASLFDADNPDLSRFAARKGKLLLWHGWSDPGLSPLATIDYYRKVVARDPKASTYAKLYMLPGVLHCGGGTGPSSVHWLDALTAWVETGAAPARLIATNSGAPSKVTLSRPLCPYPERAEYKGSGNTRDAASFVCRERHSL
jgi:hypothetical protein